VYAVNFMGPKTDPCGTLQSTDCGSDCCALTQTLSVLSRRYDLHQSNAASLTSKRWLRMRRSVWWSTVSNAALRSRRTSAHTSPESTQCTEWCHSSWIPVLSGVPQGTVVGPLLFLLYVNDITNNISSEIRLFADDCILYRQISTPVDCASLQQHITRLHNWSLTLQMVFNTK